MRGPKPKISPTDGTITRTPKPPKWLSSEAIAEWKRVAPVLVARRSLAPGDWGILENYCVAMGAIKSAQALLSLEGIVLSSGKRNPAFGVQAEAMKTATRLAQELGLTPVSRSRLQITTGDDDKDDFL